MNLKTIVTKAKQFKGNTLNISTFVNDTTKSKHLAISNRYFNADVFVNYAVDSNTTQIKYATHHTAEYIRKFVKKISNAFTEPIMTIDIQSTDSLYHYSLNTYDGCLSVNITENLVGLRIPRNSENIERLKEIKRTTKRLLNCIKTISQQEFISLAKIERERGSMKLTLNLETLLKLNYGKRN